MVKKSLLTAAQGRSILLIACRRTCSGSKNVSLPAADVEQLLLLLEDLENECQTLSVKGRAISEDSLNQFRMLMSHAYPGK